MPQNIYKTFSFLMKFKKLIGSLAEFSLPTSEHTRQYYFLFFSSTKYNNGNVPITAYDYNNTLTLYKL